MASGAGVHYFVVKERELGQKPVPALTADVVTEGTFTFDLKPQARIGARQQIVVREPGVYLLRVESQRPQRDHEHFAAMDVHVVAHWRSTIDARPSTIDHRLLTIDD